MIAAADSQEFERSVDGVTALSTFLNQMSMDGCARLPPRRSFFGAPAVEAYTNLFSHKHADMEYEEISLPTYMDPKGRLMEEVRRRSFCHTSDNVVHYNEIATVKDQRSVLQTKMSPPPRYSPYSKSSTGAISEEKCATQANLVRHGQLVNMSITIRSIKRFPDPRFPTFNRSIVIGLKALTVVSRDTEMVTTRTHNIFE